jgi:hypothetical protein
MAKENETIYVCFNSTELTETLPTNTKFILTFEDNPFNGVLLEAFCMLPSGKVWYPDGSIKNVPKK